MAHAPGFLALVQDDIAAQLRHFSHEELIALCRDFFVSLDQKEKARRQGRWGQR